MNDAERCKRLRELLGDNTYPDTPAKVTGTLDHDAFSVRCDGMATAVLDILGAPAIGVYTLVFRNVDGKMALTIHSAGTVLEVSELPELLRQCIQKISM